MALETENEKETITFSSVTRPQGSSFSSVTRPQVPRERNQKNPFKIRKDRERKEAWLAKKILSAGMPAGTENVSLNMQGMEIQLLYVTSCLINLKQKQVLSIPSAVHLYNL